jgi:hypothetical protein
MLPVNWKVMVKMSPCPRREGRGRTPPILLGRFPLEGNPGTHWIGILMGRSADLDVLEKGKISRPRRRWNPCLTETVTRLNVKPSLFRPRYAPRAPGSWGSQNFRQSTHEGHKIVSPTHRLFAPSEDALYSFLLRGWIDHRAKIRSQGLTQWKISKSPAEFEPANPQLQAYTFQFAVNCQARDFHMHSQYTL